MWIEREEIGDLGVDIKTGGDEGGGGGEENCGRRAGGVE
jgi:hypothetical protein